MLVDRARQLRRDATEAEKLVWSRLRGNQLDNARFRRQAPIGRYIADFCCFERKIIIELDGSQHINQEDYDRRRSDWLESQGFLVLRYWNSQVFRNLDGLLEEVFGHCTDRRTLGG